MDMDFEEKQREAEDLKKIEQMLHGIPEAPLPDHFDFQFKQALQKEIQREKKSKQHRVLWRRGSALAAVFLVGIVSFAMLQDSLKSTTDLAAKPDDKNLYGTAMKVAPADAPDAPVQAPPQEEQIADKGKSENGEAPAVKPQSADVKTRSYNALADATKTEGDAGTNVVLQQSQDTASISRSFGYFKTQDEYNKASDAWIDQYVRALKEEDNTLFVDTVAKGGITGYTTNTAITLFQMYTDCLETDQITYKCIGCNMGNMERSYVIMGVKNNLTVTIKADSSGLIASEPILNHGLWLSKQLEGTEYSLLGYDVRKGGDEIQFNVKVHPPMGVTGAGDLTAAGIEVKDTETQGDQPMNRPHVGEEVRGVIWTKTESSL